MTDELRLTEADFRSLAERVSNAGRWGPEDELGTLNFVTDAVRIAALRLSGRGTVVSCGAPIRSDPNGDSPSVHLSLRIDSGGNWVAVNDRLELELHGLGSATHLDALGHIFYDGVTYNGRSFDDFEPSGMPHSAIASAAGGIVTRGVLVDLARAAGKPWFDGADRGTLEHVERALDEAGIEVGSGDAVFFRTGSHAREAAQFEPFGWDEMPGLSIACAEWIHDVEAALVVSDVGLDPQPSEVDGVLIPWHVLAMSRMGLRLLDGADLEELAAVCERLGQWEFLAVVAPLSITGATSSPVNPLALF